MSKQPAPAEQPVPVQTQKILIIHGDNLPELPTQRDSARQEQGKVAATSSQAITISLQPNESVLQILEKIQNQETSNRKHAHCTKSNLVDAWSQTTVDVSTQTLQEQRRPERPNHEPFTMIPTTGYCRKVTKNESYKKWFKYV